MKNENIYYEQDNSEVQQIKEQGKIKDDSAWLEMKRKAEQRAHEAEVAMQQMKEQGMILEKEALAYYAAKEAEREAKEKDSAAYYAAKEAEREAKEKDSAAYYEQHRKGRRR